MEGLRMEVQSLQKVHVKIIEVQTENLAYWSQLPKMEDWILVISLTYDQLQVDHKAFQAKLWREKAKGCSVNFATNIT